MIALPENAIAPAIASARPGQSCAPFALRWPSTSDAPGSAAMAGVPIACDSRDDGRSLAPARLRDGARVGARPRVHAGAWLAVPLALLLFAQWPLRDLVGAWSRDANDAAQWIFALYVALALRAATRARAHMAAGLGAATERDGGDAPSTATVKRSWCCPGCAFRRRLVGATDVALAGRPRGVPRHFQPALFLDPLRRLAARASRPRAGAARLGLSARSRRRAMSWTWPRCSSRSPSRSWSRPGCRSTRCCSAPQASAPCSASRSAPSPGRSSARCQRASSACSSTTSCRRCRSTR